MERGVKLVLGTALISGVSIFLNAFGVKGIDSSVFTFLKNLLVAIFLISIILFFYHINELKKLAFRQWFLLCIIGLIGGSIPFLLFFRGLQLSTGTTSAFIHKTIFIYASLFAFFFLKEKFQWKYIIFAVFLLVGNFFLLKMNSFTFGYGEFFVLIATFFWSVENVISKYTLRDLSGSIVAFGRMAFGSLFIFFFLLITDKTKLIFSLELSQLFWIIGTSLILFLFVITYYTGLKAIPVSTATSILLLGSPITLFLDIIFLQKTITVFEVIGIFCIIVGVFFIIFFTKKTHYESISTA